MESRPIRKLGLPNAIALSSLMIIWCSAGLLKIIRPDSAAIAVTSVVPFAPGLAVIISVSLLEILMGIGLMFANTRRVALQASMLLGFGFVLMSILAEILSLNIACGCFGASGNHVLGIATLPLQVVIVALSMMLLHVPHSTETV